jgi:glutamyl-tRNA synthetase
VFPAQFRAFAASGNKTCVARFAPTPSGFLHQGNALNFILNWLVARANKGKIWLRIDDLDADRKRPEYLTDIFESLHWLGLDWDEGPTGDVDAFEKQWSQHRRLKYYTLILNQLREKDMLFACRKSRSDLAAFGGSYPAHLREQGLSLDEPDVAWRIKDNSIPGMQDFVVRRRDGVPAYQIASIADDLMFGITHVVRGADLEPSTWAQVRLAQVCGLTTFSNIAFLHHPLLLDDSGQKLSKSAGAAALKTIRSGGGAPAAIFLQVAQLLELPPVATASELFEAFTEKKPHF